MTEPTLLDSLHTEVCLLDAQKSKLFTISGSVFNVRLSHGEVLSCYVPEKCLMVPTKFKVLICLKCNLTQIY